ncbi:hypothetical protein LDVICp132 [lymphocystis disease virus-China]|uniref:Uncharacterized protein n=1 Tax=lymphocystis disease virus-China TaxID=256729 RepID=Q677Y0_9VIRU|nr:hypothetical protein LDVICp132 [lymphocystis disease virus-China]AAU10977.1 hypothetical protein [lymphocystis disease virus-China]
MLYFIVGFLETIVFIVKFLLVLDLTLRHIKTDFGSVINKIELDSNHLFILNGFEHMKY